MPKTFNTFLKHKRAGDDKYKLWQREYRTANELEKYSKVRYNEDGTVVVTDVWTKHRSIPATYKPNAVVETRFEQTDRTFYNENAQIKTQVHSEPHKRPDKHPYGEHGEHGHTFIWQDGKIVERLERELTERERIENADIL